MGRPKGSKGGFRHHSIEFKLEVIKKRLEEHYSLNELSLLYSLSSGMISNWLKRYIEEGEEGLISKPKRNPSCLSVDSKKLSEVERLKLENFKLKVENERLKKGYTVKGDGSKQEYVTLSGKIIK